MHFIPFSPLLGARIDHAHHNNEAKFALGETLSFESAVNEAVRMTSEEDTLIIVTADHSHPFNIAGYSYRGNDILGTSRHLSIFSELLLVLTFL